MSPDEVRDTTLAAVELIGNANARISHRRRARERIVTCINKALLPLARDDEHFAEAAPHLFGNDFARHLKEFLDQVKAIRSTLPSKTKEPARKPFFSRGALKEGRVRIQGRSLQQLHGPEPITEQTVEIVCTHSVNPLLVALPVQCVSKSLNPAVQCTQNVIARMGITPLSIQKVLAGQLHHFHKNWEVPTKDRWILENVRGCQ